MTFMSAVSTFPTQSHEPFNPDRPWGKIVARYEETKNVKFLRSDIEAVLSPRPNIKHCFEIIPTIVTRELIEICFKLGYKFFLLTRSNEADRLLSLALATATGAWGPETAQKIYPRILTGEVKVPPLSVQDSVKRARLDASSLGDTLKLLRHRNIPYEWLVFEEIYQGKISTEEQAIRIVSTLGVQTLSNDPRLASFRESSGQNSRSIQPYIGNIEAVRFALKNICIP